MHTLFLSPRIRRQHATSGGQESKLGGIRCAAAGAAENRKLDTQSTMTQRDGEWYTEMDRDRDWKRETETACACPEGMQNVASRARAGAAAALLCSSRLPPPGAWTTYRVRTRHRRVSATAGTAGLAAPRRRPPGPPAHRRRLISPHGPARHATDSDGPRENSGAPRKTK